MTKKQIVVVGGGTGTHTVLRGLRQYAGDVDIVAVVSMADSGGSTGRLRDEFGFLPVGDVRNALTALASEDDILRRLFLYRFEKGAGLSGHNFGNLFLTALTDILGSELAAIEAASRVLQVAGRVVPVTTSNVDLRASYNNGQVVVGEEAIEAATSYQDGSRITSLSLTPRASLNPVAALAMYEADLIVFGPGDLYTSIVANLVVDGFREVVAESRAHIVYVCNLMSRRGQTGGMHVAEHVAEIEKYLGRSLDTALVNTGPLPADLLAKYAQEGEHPILNNWTEGAGVIRALPLVSEEAVQLSSGDTVKRSLIRHDSAILATELLKLL